LEDIENYLFNWNDQNLKNGNDFDEIFKKNENTKNKYSSLGKN
jgi:hypothetical protein